jgi:phage shock protein A
MSKITPLFGGKAGQPPPEGEEPGLTGLIGEMTEHLVAAKNRVFDSQKEERRLAKQSEGAARAAGEWEQRAMAAVRAGDDVVARDALLRKRQHELQDERFRAAGREQHRQTDALNRALVELDFRIEETKHKRNMVVGRAERAAALPPPERMAKDPSGLDADEMLKRLQAKMTDIETELELSDQAIANLTREAGDALRTQGELARKSKPLAKTLPNDAESTLPSASQAVGVSGPPRTKR